MSQTENYQTISPKQARAIVAMVEEPTLEAAADAVGISRATLRRWQANPDFASALATARRAAMGEATSLLASLTVKAAQTLGAVLDSELATANHKIRAAQAILENARAAIELDELAGRILELERLESEREGRRNR